MLDVPGVDFYSLQLGRAAQQIVPFQSRINDLSAELTGWCETAGALMELDLLISIDSAVANLAGALGCPVWICLSPAPDWRWMLDRRDSPWYPSARLFRQPRVGDWESVFAEVVREPRPLVAALDIGTERAPPKAESPEAPFLWRR